MNWYNIIIATHTTSPAMLSYLAPYNGTAITEYLRDNGYDSLICYDDFSKHAKVYRQISLIQGRVPGRDAYPADIFNVHAALLERAGKIKWICGNGSITAFPIIETIHCDVTEYIATNLISITDGQLYTNGILFKNGYRPAIDSGLSVSRVGSSAQFILLNLLVGTIKNDLTNYRQYLESSQLGDCDDDVLMNKGRSIEYIYYQDYLDGSAIEQTIFLLILLLNGVFNNFIHEQYIYLYSLIKYLSSTEWIYWNYL